ncbi:MAG: MFS transporter [Proteobacteria bacterium]|nr:MFS transporter [Pseudomonadota bacterium]
MSYLFRSINAVIAGDLTVEFHLSAADLGLLTAVYFLTFVIAQLPLSSLLDRLEPNAVQSVLMLFSTVGALLFAEAHSFTVLVIGRGLIGLGAAGTLTAALKAIVTWTPTERMPLATGLMVMFGALGAFAATGPADVIAQHIGWRALFAVLAASMALSALAVLLNAPKATVRARPRWTASSLSAVYRNQRFWRIAPVCALGVGSSWSLQSLWAAPWMRDVQGFDQTSIVHQLGVMAFAVCIGGPIFGLLSTRLRGLGIKIEYLLLGTLSLSFLAQIALILRWPLPLLVLWVTISAAGATTVLSSALISGYFPESLSARANGSLNFLHVGGALVLQSATGLILAQWPNERGAYPVAAYQAGLAIPLILQFIALAWFLTPRRRSLPSMQYAISGPHRGPYFRPGSRSHCPAPSFLLSS